MHSPDTEPTEQEFDQLEVFLEESDPEAGMPLDAIDGMFAAIVSGPEVIMPSEWMPAIWFGHAPEWDSIADAQEMLDIIMKWYNHVVRTIADGTYEPVMSIWEDPETSEEIEDPEDWCRGFLEGMKLRTTMWENQVRAEPALQDLIEPIFLVAEGSEEIGDALADPQIRRQMVDAMSSAVFGIRDFWLARATPN